MRRVRQRQLELAFAANPDQRELEGGSLATASGVPVAKAWLRRIAKSTESNSLAAGVAERLVSLWDSWRQRYPVELPSQPVSDGGSKPLCLLDTGVAFDPVVM